MLLIENRPKKVWRVFERKRLRFMVMRRDNWTCQYCGRSAKDGAILTTDHLIPLSKGGDWTWDNLVCCCEFCNTGKSDLLLSDEEIERFSCPASIVGPVKT